MNELGKLANGTEECRAVIAEKSKSFALASKLLPAESRDDVIALYAWCRRADDAIDNVAEEHQSAAVDKLFTEMKSVYSGEAQKEPVLQLFQGLIAKYQIPEEYPLELVRGMDMDARGVRYTDLRELLLYCYRVAGVVGLMMCHILGVRSKAALAQAAHLGIAMQLTNISRDVAEDWERGRLYIPAEWLPATLAQPEAGQSVPKTAESSLKEQVARLLSLADDYYKSADRGIPSLPFRAALAVRAARSVYSAIGNKIRRVDFAIFDRRVYVSTSHKLLLCFGAFLWTLFAFIFTAGAFRSVRRLSLPVKGLDDVISV